MPLPATKCRLCGENALELVLDLGQQALTGVFPKSATAKLTSGPLALVRCQQCGMVQLSHGYAASELYGAHYGYRSGLNQHMVRHLQTKAKALEQAAQLAPGDWVLDIGSNDGTFLGAFAPSRYHLLGMDPSAEKFRHYYRADLRLAVDFFSATSYRQVAGTSQARLVTSMAMFYDLEQPLAFARQVRDILAPDGLWHMEQSYLPAMLRAMAYDTICHEHLEYYALAQIQYVAQACDLKIVALEENDINGGSFAVTLAPRAAPQPEATRALAEWQAREQAMGLQSAQPYRLLESQIKQHRDALLALLHRLRGEGKRVLGYGASTKGNVLLQYCGITPDLLPAIAEVNPDKFGCFTPGTGIPIISETEAHARRPDYFLVLPWHFREPILAREQAYLKGGGKFIFPLPEISIVGA